MPRSQLIEQLVRSLAHSASKKSMHKVMSEQQGTSSSLTFATLYNVVGSYPRRATLLNGQAAAGGCRGFQATASNPACAAPQQLTYIHLN